MAKRKSNILFLLSHQPNPRFTKQMKFLSSFFSIDLVCFHRNELWAYPPELKGFLRKSIELVSIPSGKYLKRIILYSRMIFKLSRHLKNNKYQIVIVNNIDTLWLFTLARLFSARKINSTAIKVLQISDLREFFFTKGIRSTLLRWINSKSVLLADKLVLTSNRFYDFYRHAFDLSNTFILLNKPLSCHLLPLNPERIMPKSEKTKKIIIGLVGQLRHKKSYMVLLDYISSSSIYELNIHGVGPCSDLLEKYSNLYSNINYFGPYNYSDNIVDIYSQLDCIYSVYHDPDKDKNIKYALPNKLYESMCFSVPIIVASETYLSEVVSDYSIGFNIKAESSEELATLLDDSDFIHKCSICRGNCNRLNSNLYIGDKDYQEYVKFLKEN